MPPARRNPALLAGPDGQPELTGPSPEELQAEHLDDNEQMVETPLMYEGELLSTSMTAAIVLPGDSHPSYYRAQFTGRVQPDETADDLANRAITVVRDTVLAQLDDSIDAFAEYMANLQASGRIPHA